MKTILNHLSDRKTHEFDTNLIVVIILIPPFPFPSLLSVTTEKKVLNVFKYASLGYRIDFQI